MPEEPGAPAVGALHALLQHLYRRLQAVLAQHRLDLVQGDVPFGLQGHGLDLARRTVVLEMGHDMGADPAAGGRIGECAAVVETQLHQPRQTLQEQGEMHFDFPHRLLGVEPLQALPDQALAVEPERRPCQARLQLHQEIGVQALGETLLVAFQLVRRHSP